MCIIYKEIRIGGKMYNNKQIIINKVDQEIMESDLYFFYLRPNLVFGNEELQDGLE